MYAVFGEVQFELPTYYEGLDVRFAADYAEHPLIGRKPRLQAMGDQLDEIRQMFMFHAAFCNPEMELAKLVGLVRSHEARQFVLGSGVYKGWFVLTELEVITRQTDERGSLLCIEANGLMREHVDPLTEETRQAQARRGASARRAGMPRQNASATQAVLDARDGWAVNGRRAPGAN